MKTQYINAKNHLPNPCLQLCKVQHPNKYYLRYYHTLLFVNADHFYYVELSYIIFALPAPGSLLLSGFLPLNWMGVALWGPGPELIKSSGWCPPHTHTHGSQLEPALD